MNESTKNTLSEILAHVKSQDRTVIEFNNTGDSLTVADITDHVDELES